MNRMPFHDGRCEIMPVPSGNRFIAAEIRRPRPDGNCEATPKYGEEVHRDGSKRACNIYYGMSKVLVNGFASHVRLQVL